MTAHHPKTQTLQPSVKFHKAPDHVDKFIKTMMPIAEAVQKKWGVPKEVVIAQAAQETGWGKHVKGNSYFGVKGKSPKGASVNFTTHEEGSNGKKSIINDKFRAYKNVQEAADDYGHFLASNHNFKAAFAHKTQPLQFASQLKKYATDSKYTSNIQSIIKHHFVLSPTKSIKSGKH